MFCRRRDSNPLRVRSKSDAHLTKLYALCNFSWGYLLRGRSKTTFFVLPIVDLVRKHKNSKQKLKIENIGF